MKTESPALAPTRQIIPASWQAGVQAQLQPGETALASLELDLDLQLHFAPGIVVATDRRLLARTADGDWSAWPYAAGLALAHHDHAGVGTLELHDATRRLAAWRYTLGQNPEALRLIAQFDLQCTAAASGAAVAPPVDATCPSCHAPLPEDAEECPVCVRELHTPPSTWTLFRLWRFAQPYKGQLILGFLLTLASTAATLVPPYLTMPLMDNVLIPYQNGQSIDVSLVTLYLSGLFGAAL